MDAGFFALGKPIVLLEIGFGIVVGGMFSSRETAKVAFRFCFEAAVSLVAAEGSR